MPGTTPSIAFVGFMGAGKTTAARSAARVLGADFVDTDELIAREIGGSIAGFFANQGEERFREIEQRVVLEALTRGGVVIALGGGAIESERVREALDGHVTTWCQVEEAEAWERASGTDRPLARDRDAFRRRLAAREPLYLGVSRVVLPGGGTELGATVAPWLGALRALPEVSLIWAATDSGSYPAAIGPGSGALLAVDDAPRLGARLFAIADRRALREAGGLLPDLGEAEAFEVDGGEPAKTLASAERLLAELAAAGVRRDDALLAFGGGVVGDLAGFCASVYQRGVPIVQIPTTLVAQVDSAYGGKTGVDLAAAKNYVGTYHQPAAVLADPSALRSLPPAELAAGFAEVVKTALIVGGRLWERVRAIGELSADTVAPLVFDCALAKIEIVAADERDAGGRAVLNLGHTVGHAIEAATGYATYRHGEAISLGLLASLRLSGADGLREEVAGILARAGLPVQLDGGVDVDAVLEATGRDKKRTTDGVGFVLLAEPGSPVHGERVDPDSLRAAVEELVES